MSRLSGLSTRTLVQGVATVLAAVAVGLFAAPALFGSGGSGHEPQLDRTTTAAAAPAGFRAFDAREANRSRYTTLIATARHSRIRVYRRRDGRLRPAGVLRRRTLGRQRLPLVMSAVGSRSEDGWLRVRLPVRPNGSVAWVRRDDVDVTATNYRLTIRLKAHRLDLRRGRFLVMSKPIGVGRALSPTPHGTYYLTDLIRSTDPFYGPYAFGLSAFSTVYTTFEGGNGQVGIHGTNAPSAIGTDVSHGCIRVRNDVIRRLAKLVPLGTPVRIEA